MRSSLTQTMCWDGMPTAVRYALFSGSTSWTIVRIFGL